MTDESGKLHDILKTAGHLVRQSTTPHAPIWVPGAEYPAQYLVRQTRSMTTRYNTLVDDTQEEPVCPVLLVSIPRHVIVLKRPRLPALTRMDTLDFFLPDSNFLQLKLEKLKSVQAKEGDSIIKVRDVSHTKNSIPVTSDAQNHLDSNKMLNSHTSHKEVFKPVQPNSCHCTFTPLNQSGHDSAELISMGYQCIPLQSNNSFYWVISENGSKLLIIADGAMCLYDSGGKLVNSVIAKGITDLQCLKLYAKGYTTLAAIGAVECNIWVFKEDSLNHYNLFKGESHQYITGLDIIESGDSKSMIATAFKLPSVSLWLSTLILTKQSDMIVENQFTLPIPLGECPLTSLHFIQNSKYLLGISNQLIIWDYPSATLIKKVSLECYPSERPLSALILYASLEKDHIFVVICAKPPTPTLSNSCCWLVTVSMTTCPSSLSRHNEVVDRAHEEYAYLLPSNISKNKLIRAVSIRLSHDRLTVVLSNDVIVLWDLIKPHPIGYFTVSGLHIHSCLLSKDKLWLYSSTENVIYVFNN